MQKFVTLMLWIFGPCFNLAVSNEQPLQAVFLSPFCKCVLTYGSIFFRSWINIRYIALNLTKGHRIDFQRPLMG